MCIYEHYYEEALRKNLQGGQFQKLIEEEKDAITIC